MESGLDANLDATERLGVEDDAISQSLADTPAGLDPEGHLQVYIYTLSHFIAYWKFSKLNMHASLGGFQL